MKEWRNLNDLLFAKALSHMFVFPLCTDKGKAESQRPLISPTTVWVDAGETSEAKWNWRLGAIVPDWLKTNQWIRAGIYQISQMVHGVLLSFIVSALNSCQVTLK